MKHVFNLTKEEKELEAAIERGEYKSVPNFKKETVRAFTPENVKFEVL